MAALSQPARWFLFAVCFDEKNEHSFFLLKKILIETLGGESV
jgi:hypothetical protein